MEISLLKVVVVSTALWFLSVVDGTPVSVMHGDLCRRMNGRKYYLEADTHAIITATNVTVPAFPRIATRAIKSPPVPFHHSSRRHRREGPQEIGLMEPRFRRNITSISLSSLASANMVPPKAFVSPQEATRILTPLRTPTLDTNALPPPPPPPPSAIPSTASPTLILDEAEEDLQAESDVTTSLSQPSKCGVEILTRPDCHLELVFEKVNLPSCSHDKSCRCDYLRLREPPYRGVGGLDVCSTGDETPTTFTTQTKEARLDFLYTRTYEDAFTVGITAKRNKYLVTGKVNNTVGYIRSPFFPELYPKEHWMEYELVAQDENARIKVTFLDFQLSPWSFVEIQDTNKSRLAVFNGNLFRPPVLVSSGPHLTVRFSGNGETARGFNLLYQFVDAASPAVMPPMTDCGGYVTNFGGTITMMNMSKDTNYTMYDCVWIVQPPQNYAFKSHLSIRVVQFEDMASATTLEIRQGLTSDDYLLERIDGGKPKRTQEHVVAVDTGFYVRLRGFFNKDSKLAIVYSSFSYLGNCYSMTDLMCHNHRCIPKMLRCDGFDHCGDNSDEPANCYVGAGNKGLTPEDAAWWYQHTPNYYFPQKSNFLGSHNGWSGVLLLTSLIVMVILMIGLISYMFKQSSDRTVIRERRHAAHSRRGSISDDVEVIDASADDPPLYEPPPDYEEVIKVILSGNNLKLVRRPGGLTAWVPDKLADEGANGDNPPKNDRPLRTRHASLDLEQGMEVVLWNSSTSGTPRNNSIVATASNENESRATLAPIIPFHMGHIRRSSLPTAPTPDAIQNDVQGHSVSIAPENIPEIAETPRPAIRHVHTMSSPQISIRSFSYDTSIVSTPGPSTPQIARSSPKRRKSKKVSKKGGKRKRSSAAAAAAAAARRVEQREARDDSAPPSYEDAMQQVVQSEVQSPTPIPEAPSISDAAGQVNESTQTISDSITNVDNEDLSPSDRVHAAREMFQRLSNGDPKPVQVAAVAHGSQHVAKRPAVQVNRAKHHKGSSSGGTISRGTVKARKAMLLKAQKLRRECACNGACSCAHFKAESPSEETPFAGGVKSRVKYYLTIEESTKKREHDSSVEQLSDRPELQSSHKISGISDFNMSDANISDANISDANMSDTNTAALKKRKLVRNQSAPTIGHIRERDLGIYFSQNDGLSEIATPSPIEDMERPLISPVSDSPRTVFIIPKNTMGREEEGSDHEIIPSIQNRVKLYNDLTKPENQSPLPRTPSPIRSPVEGIKVKNMMRSESMESLDDGKSNSLICMRSMKTTSSEPSIKPGMVKEATAKFISSLATEIRPKFCTQDSDDWNGSSDSPLPVRIPYLNLKNEEVSSSPDIYENDNLILPPLRKEEAESIELWDSISQGVSEREELIQNTQREASPSASSGAVPKRSAGEITIKLGQKNRIKHARPSQNREEPAVRTKSLQQNELTVSARAQRQNDTAVATEYLRENDKDVKSHLKLNIKDKFSPASEAGEKYHEKLYHQQKPTSRNSKVVLQEVNLGPKTLTYQSSSDEDSLPPTPQRRKNLNDTLNETLESDVDLDVVSRMTPTADVVMSTSESPTSLPKPSQEIKAKKRIPIPSPRGSKASQPKLSQSLQNSSANVQSHSRNQSAEDVRPIGASSPVYNSTPNSPRASTDPLYSNGSTPRTLMTPTLSPQMERSGIVTINTNKKLRWDYI